MLNECRAPLLDEPRAAMTPEEATPAIVDGESDVDLLHFTYFVVRLQHAASMGRPPELSGVIERLVSGEKCTFRNAAELVRLLQAWAQASETVPAPTANKEGNA